MSTNKGFILLDRVLDVNNFQPVNELHLIRGNQSTLYFQIVDWQSFKDCIESYKRVMPQGANIEVKVTFLDIDEAFTVERMASQPFPDDRSIWSVEVLSTDQLAPNSMMVSLLVDGDEELLMGLGDLRFSDTGKRNQFC